MNISHDRDIILTVNVVEEGLVGAVKMHSQKLGRELKGLVLVHKDFVNAAHRPKDETGLFKEIICDCGNPNEIQTALRPYLDRILAVTYRYENSVESLHKILPFVPYVYKPSESALIWSTDKAQMRDRLSNYDSNLTPRYKYIEESDLSRLSELLRDFDFPVIIKPSGLVESLLVERCETEAELHHKLDRTFKVIHDIYDREYRLNKPGVLVEEFMQGEMYSTDAYVTHDGEIFCLPLVKVITAESIGLPGFYSYRHIIPVELPPKEIEAAFLAARSAIKALNLSSSGTHIEMYRTANGWKIIELAARIGGYREDLYREVYGIEHFYNDLAVRMGQRPIMPSGKPRGHAAGMNIYAESEGEIESIEGFEEAQQVPSVRYLKLHANPGDTALFAGNGGHLIVDGILHNQDKDQLERDVARVRELVKINIKKK